MLTSRSSLRGTGVRVVAEAVRDLRRNVRTKRVVELTDARCRTLDECRLLAAQPELPRDVVRVRALVDQLSERVRISGVGARDGLVEIERRERASYASASLL